MTDNDTSIALNKQSFNLDGSTNKTDLDFYKVDAAPSDCSNEAQIKIITHKKSFKQSKLEKTKIAYVLSEINFNIDTVSKIRKGINYTCVVDTSGSMEGIQITEVQSTLFQMLDYLKQQDTITLIKFDREAETCFLQRCAKQQDQKKEMLDIIEKRLVADKTTQIASGMKKAFQEIKTFKDNRPNVVFLLSDGKDNPQDHSCISKIRQYYFDAIKSGQTVSISTFGFGSEHDSEILESLSRISGGFFKYIPNFKEINQILLETLQKIQEIEVSGAKITVEFDSKYDLKGYGGFWVSSKSESNQISTYMDFVNNAPKRLVYKLDLKEAQIDATSIVSESLVKDSEESVEIITKVNRLPIGKITLNFLGADDQMKQVVQPIELIITDDSVEDEYEIEVCADVHQERGIQAIQNSMLSVRKKDKQNCTIMVEEVTRRSQDIQDFISQYPHINHEMLQKVMNELKQLLILLKDVILSRYIDEDQIHTVTSKTSTLSCQTSELSCFSNSIQSDNQSCTIVSDKQQGDSDSQSYTIVTGNSQIDSQTSSNKIDDMSFSFVKN